MKQLYFIENMGCDATTHGLIELTNEEFIAFKTFIENLNKNSYYGCMPTICAYRANWADFRECEYNKSKDPWDDGYVDRDYVFFYNNKTYTFKEEYFSYYREWEQVI